MDGCSRRIYQQVADPAGEGHLLAVVRAERGGSLGGHGLGGLF